MSRLVTPPIELKGCDHCGGKAELRHVPIWGTYGYQVRCSGCGLRTGISYVNRPCLGPGGRVDESTRYTDAKAQMLAVEQWNTRRNEAG